MNLLQLVERRMKPLFCRNIGLSDCYVQQIKDLPSSDWWKSLQIVGA